MSSCTSLIYVGGTTFYNSQLSFTSLALPIPSIDGLTFVTWRDGDVNDVTQADNLQSSYIAMFEEQLISLSGMMLSDKDNSTVDPANLKSTSTSSTRFSMENSTSLKSETTVNYQVKLTIRNHSVNAASINSITTSSNCTLSWNSGSINSGGSQEVIVIYPTGDYSNTIVIEGDNLIGVTELEVSENGIVVEQDVESSISGINKSIVTKDFAIYPNPVKDILYINTESNTSLNEISIIDIAGNTVYSNFNSNVTSIDIRNLQPGVYFMSMNGHTQKFIKE